MEAWKTIVGYSLPRILAHLRVTHGGTRSHLFSTKTCAAATQAAHDRGGAEVRAIMERVVVMAAEEVAPESEVRNQPTPLPPGATMRVEAAGLGWDRASERLLPPPPGAALDRGAGLSGAWAPHRNDDSFPF